jgi:hydroxymethylpyrimidine pyrophosphatase-like HAD family hydrolase
MLEVAGLSIAMGNAEEELKEIADYITVSNDESGVSHAVYKYILKGNGEV